ncbi:potassium/sodium hyperpolarization-activated cyclic nucleotide-gated channel 3-like [Anoplophora glabripennis]|uniref:potassium/sodium hyperpolarization-activated cyclic nucleotide-gated channel 3-like n=1 Tax=Anoplophora glabripennis TaxID=217634 RepID=UPI0008741241|nr:potassium/sodium hyperpolarization-activated cyclic nucleotide-gated channel 3-like [Anoplophora glabripennis]
MSKNQHKCSLPVKDDSGLPKLAPNAHWAKKLGRVLRMLIVVNPNHTKCKKLFRNKAEARKERKRHISGPHYFVIHPLSTLDAILDATFVILWLYFLIVEPLINFLGVEIIDSIVDVHRKVMTPIQLVLISLFFNRGYIDEKNNRIVLESKKIIRRYLFTYFIFDYLSTYFALEIPAGWIIQREEIKRIAEMTAYFIRVFAYSVRIPTVIEYMNYSLGNLKFNKTLASLICHTVKTYLILHIFSFMIFVLPILYYIIRQSFPRRSWIIKTAVYAMEPTQKYFAAFRLVFCLFFGISYVYIEVLNEQIYAVIISFTGRLYTLYLLADILSMLGITGVSESKYQRSMSSIQHYMANQHLPDNIKQRVLRYCKFKFEGQYFEENQIRSTLSDNLRAELFLFSARKIIQKVELFKQLPHSAIASIMEVMKSETFSPNDIIVTIGSEISEVYFVSSGTVAVTNSAGYELCHLDDGDEFGTSCLFFQKQKYAVVAIETTEVFVINKNELMEFVHPYPDVLNGFYRSAKERLAKLKHLGDRAATRDIDLFRELESGNILEAREARLTADH